MTADGIVSSDPKNVYALVITATGATAGDAVGLRDGGATDTLKLRFEIPAAAGIWAIELGRYGVAFTTAIYYAEIATAASKIKVNVVFG